MPSVATLRCELDDLRSGFTKLTGSWRQQCQFLHFNIDWVRHYFHHYLRSGPADFHTDLTARLDTLHLRRGSKEAIIAPCEGAKSTLVTLAYAIRVAVEQLEPYTLALSDSGGQAVENLMDIRRELEGTHHSPRHICGY